MITEDFISDLGSTTYMNPNSDRAILLSNICEYILEALKLGKTEIHCKSYSNILNPHRSDNPSNEQIFSENDVIECLRDKDFNVYHNGKYLVIDWKDIM